MELSLLGSKIHYKYNILMCCQQSYNSEPEQITILASCVYNEYCNYYNINSSRDNAG